MDAQFIITVIAGILGAVGGAFVTGAFNKRKIAAEAESIVLENYRKLIDELQQEVARLRERSDRFDEAAEQIRIFHNAEIRRLEDKHATDLAKALAERDAKIAAQETRICHLEAENDALANEQENNNAQTLKLQYAYVISMDQIRQLGREPVIDLSDIETMTVEDLKRIARGIAGAQERKAAARRRKAENE